MLLAFEKIAGHHIITWVIIGLIAGLIAAKLVDGGGLGFFRDTVTGILGAIIGGFLLHAAQGGAKASPNVFVEGLIAFAGAVILLLLVKAVTHRGRRRRGVRI